MTDKIVVLTTCSSEKQATRLARHLVEHHFVACVNILPQARSIYRWPDKSGKDKIETAAEYVLLIKSRRDRFAAVRAAIEKLHTYEVPEIIAVPVVEGAAAYLDWMDRELTVPGE
jgi:periplasmic divalent cation tolerance protein